MRTTRVVQCYSGLTYKQALRGLFTSGTSIDHQSFSDGGQDPERTPTYATATAGKKGKGRQSTGIEFHFHR